MSLRVIPVDLERPSIAWDGLIPEAKTVLRESRLSQPNISQRVARAEGQRLLNVSLRVFGATDKNLSQADLGMGVGEISVQRQRIFAFGDA